MKIKDILEMKTSLENMHEPVELFLEERVRTSVKKELEENGIKIKGFLNNPVVTIDGNDYRAETLKVKGGSEDMKTFFKNLKEFIGDKDYYLYHFQTMNIQDDKSVYIARGVLK